MSFDSLIIGLENRRSKYLLPLHHSDPRLKVYQRFDEFVQLLRTAVVPFCLPGTTLPDYPSPESGALFAINKLFKKVGTCGLNLDEFKKLEDLVEDWDRVHNPPGPVTESPPTPKWDNEQNIPASPIEPAIVEPIIDEASETKDTQEKELNESAN